MAQGSFKSKGKSSGGDAFKKRKAAPQKRKNFLRDRELTKMINNKGMDAIAARAVKNEGKFNNMKDLNTAAKKAGDITGGYKPKRKKKTESEILKASLKKATAKLDMDDDETGERKSKKMKTGN